MTSLWWSNETGKVYSLKKQNLKGTQMTRKVKVILALLTTWICQTNGSWRSNKQIQDISGACSLAISRWKRQYKAELSEHTPSKANA